ncbi:protein NO VEIN domain-containing protein [Amphritea balenae]|uniref:DUF3883 domain-containing protein n=1 Tax=Amphritea balenae TaxID=452629 RepID=A0A3P1SN74_9GAMM|nr:DUF3883 domain-containing protein [Amphritea balenae]RRC98490.1 DUF3883 domain-containing protein [Amphritea balenae]GGK64898.1 hypothetical protein GCM10007941_13810 [Amphritea balenae]
MRRELFVKRLSASDATFIDSFFIRSNADTSKKKKQKAIVIPKPQIVELSPVFASLPRSEVIHIDTCFYGPLGNTAAIRKAANIGKHSKDWRLQHCIIHESDAPGRFDTIDTGDIFIFELFTEDENFRANAVLVSQTASEDSAAYSALNSLLGSKTSTLISRESLADSLPTRDQEHAISIVLNESFDDPQDKDHNTQITSGSRKISKKAFESMQRRNNEIGDKGEDIIDQWLSTHPYISGKKITRHVWESKINHCAQFDFRATTDTNEEIRLEVKSTTGTLNAPFYVSIGELENMATNLEKTFICRVYALSNETSEIAISGQTQTHAQTILSTSFPDGASLCTSKIEPAKMFDFRPTCFFENGSFNRI